MRAFRAPLGELGEIEEIRGKLKKNQGVLQITGCIDSQKAHLIDCLGEGYSHKIIVTANDLKAKELYENVRFFDREARCTRLYDLARPVPGRWGEEYTQGPRIL